jgi:hypothetical protein
VKKNVDVSAFDEQDYWYREIVYCVEGSTETDECPECHGDISDRRRGWSYCPFCGADIEGEEISEEYTTEQDAKRSAWYGEFGITEKMRFGVRKRPDNPDDALGALNG